MERWQDYVLDWSNVITRTIDDRLLPCPFCGTAAWLVTRPSFREFFVMCSNHGCGASLTRFDNNAFPAAEAAVAAWNNRHK